MSKHYLRLQHSESIVAQTATQIYATYLAAGRIPEGEQDKWIERSVSEAIQIAKLTDEQVISDDEIDSISMN